MKKLLILFFMFFSFNIFSVDWVDYGIVIDNPQVLKPGDILVLKKEMYSLQTLFGHLAYVNKDLKIVDFKRINYGYIEQPVYAFAPRDRKVKILRYKYMNDKLLDNIEEEIKLYYDSMYDIFSDPDEKYTDAYCSIFVYQIFRSALEKMGVKDNRIADDTRTYIFPYDFLNNNLTYEIDILGEIK